jgi:tripartite-type tricarboxylate transporter receptor subunit TctC
MRYQKLLAIVCAMAFTFGVDAQTFAPAHAQAADAPGFPLKPVRWVVPYPPGGSIDVVARVIAARLSHAWGSHCYVDNRLGAGGRVGVQAVIAAPPDGYTQLMALNTNYTIDRSVFKSLGYDPEKALMPITIVATTAQLLISNLSFPPKNVKELVALAKARPYEINYGSSGAGGSLHLAIELFKSMTGTQMTHVPYKGGVPAAADLIAGQIQVMFINAPAGAPYIRAGKVRGLGISTVKRSPYLPDVPTIMEAGVPGFNIDVWYGLSAPAGTPPAIINQMYQDVTLVLNEADVRKQLIGYGADPVSATPDEMARRIRTETVTWAKVIQGSSIKFE